MFVMLHTSVTTSYILCLGLQKLYVKNRMGKHGLDSSGSGQGQVMGPCECGNWSVGQSGNSL